MIYQIWIMWFGTFFDDESEQIINSENACLTTLLI